MMVELTKSGANQETQACNMEPPASETQNAQNGQTTVVPEANTDIGQKPKLTFMRSNRKWTDSRETYRLLWIENLNYSMPCFKDDCKPFFITFTFEIKKPAGNNDEVTEFLRKGCAVVIRMRGLPYDCTPQQIVSGDLHK